MSLQHYIDKFRSLTVNRARGHVSPHKVCMVLAVMDLIQSGDIPENRIEFSQPLLDKFRFYFEEMASPSDRYTPHLPYFHLHSEGFWHHQLNPGQQQAYDALRTSNSENKVRNTIAYAYLDDELFDYLRYHVVSGQLKSALLKNLDAEVDEDLRSAITGWSRLECELIVRDYLDMLEKELRGESFSKAAHRRALRPFLNERSEASIEFKHQNISAVMIDLGLPYIKGYRPAYNYQRLLLSVATEQSRRIIRLVDTDQLGDLKTGDEKDLQPDWDNWQDAPPEKQVPDKIQQVREFVPRYGNFAEKENRNRHLGMLGEKFVLEYEKYRLQNCGRQDLIADVEWTSKERGDGAGYDIRSFTGSTDEELFIEVKTTVSGKHQPFFISENELAFSQAQADQYALYRVFQFKANPRLFTLPGDIREHVNLEAESYRASF